MAPKLAAEYSELRKEQVLSAAWQCFQEKGFKDTTVREIARRMGASTGVIYTYFDGKDKILEAILAQNLNRNLELFDRARNSLSSRGALQELFSIYLECCPVSVLKQGAKCNIDIWSEAAKREEVGKTVSRYYTKLLDHLALIVEESDAHSAASSVDPKSVAGFYLAFQMGLELQLALIDGLDTDGYIESMKMMLFEQSQKTEESPLKATDK